MSALKPAPENVVNALLLRYSVVSDVMPVLSNEVRRLSLRTRVASAVIPVPIKEVSFAVEAKVTVVKVVLFAIFSVFNAGKFEEVGPEERRLLLRSSDVSADKI